MQSSLEQLEKAESLLPINRKVTRRQTAKADKTDLVSAWRHLDAYVLLGEPGQGKTTVFKQEAAALGDAALYVTAKDFLSLEHQPDGRTLFIDALDERRSTLGDASAPLEHVRRELQRLGKPRFRLSCRTADWIAGGATDLAVVSPNGVVDELRLEPLDEPAAHELLALWLPAQAGNAQKFVDKAKALGLQSMLQSPLLLKLLVKAVRGNAWPKDRSAVYDLACADLAIEHDTRRRLASARPRLNKDELLDAAGRLYALLLLSDCDWLTLDHSDAAPRCIVIDEIPDALGIERTVLQEVLDSKLFGAEGLRRGPWHRTIAEFLGARSIAKLICERGLPVGRVLSIMTGKDGGVIDSLRGLYGWLAFHCLPERTLLIDADPVALIVYGDIGPFSTNEKRQLLRALRREAQNFPWFRSDNWDRHPFGALGISDLIDDFREPIRSTDRSFGHVAYLECVIDAIRHGEALPDLATDLHALLADVSHSSHTRSTGAEAWLRCVDFDEAACTALLDDISSGRIVDCDDEILGRVLTKLYPDHIGAERALQYLHREKSESLVGWYQMFWKREFLRHCPSGQLIPCVEYLRGLYSRPDVSDECNPTYQENEFIRELARPVLCKAVVTHGDDVPVETLHRWLGIGINAYGQSESKGDEFGELRSWLAARPEKMRHVFLCEVARPTLGLEQAREWPWSLQAILHDATLPADWYQWILDVASNATDEVAFVKAWLLRSTFVAINSTQGFSIELPFIEHWIETQRKRWPKASDWVLDVSSCAIDSPLGEQHRRAQATAESLRVARDLRRTTLEPWVEKIKSGIAPPGIFYRIAYSYRGLFSDVQGNTGVARVQSFLGGSLDEAAAAVNGLKLVLDRRDLPTVEDVHSAHAKKQQFDISPACTLAAEILFSGDSSVTSRWSPELAKLLSAFMLLNEIEHDTPWFKALCIQRLSDLVDTIQPILEQEVSNKEQPHIPMLAWLGMPAESHLLAKAILPGLIKAVPAIPTQGQLWLFNRQLLPAALEHFSPEELQTIVFSREKEADISLDFYISLQTARIETEPELCVLVLADLLSQEPDLALSLRAVLSSQRHNWQVLLNERPYALSLISELLATAAVRSGGEAQHESGDPFKDGLRFIHQFADLLASSSSPDAVYELSYLRDLPCMQHWRLQLDYCCGRQQKLIRSSTYAAPTYQEAARMLLNKTPASPGDMCALMIDHLCTLANRIRQEETNLLDLFWESDGHKGKKPLSENKSRDVLQSLLRDRLQAKGVQLEKESHAAADKRADLACIASNHGNRILVPIEIKKDDHREVWTASWGQLEARYTAHPDAGGKGIYLVLWFGVRPQSDPNGKKPSSAMEMAEMLTNRMPSRQWSNIKGLVVDLSER